MQNSEPKFDSDRYNAIRSMIRHEDDLISSRTGWMIACQALLITSIGLGDFDFVPKVLVCVLGLAVSWQSWANLCFAQRAVFKLKNLWTKADEDKYPNHPDVIGLRGKRTTLSEEPRTPPVKQAIAFFFFWIALLIYFCVSSFHCEQNLFPSLQGFIQCEIPPQKMLMTWPGQ